MASLRFALTAACAGLLLLSGCSASASPAASPSSEATPQGGRPQQARMNGTYGLIADISGTTLQVQGTSGQTAVTYTDATAFTQQKAGTPTDLVEGVCVTVRGEEGTDGAVTAQSIAVTAVEDGQCSGFGGGFGGGGGGGGGFGGGQGGMPSGAPTDMPRGAMPSGMPQGGQGRPEGGRPSGAPSGFPAGGGAAGGMVMGLVESVGDGTLTVAMTRPGEDAASSTVTFDSTVTVTTTADASASALAVGRCVSASGDPDETGAVSATAIRVSDAVDGACTRRETSHDDPDSRRQR